MLTGCSAGAAAVRRRLEVRSCGVLASVSCLLPAPAFWLGCLTFCCGLAAFSGSLPCSQERRLKLRLSWEGSQLLGAYDVKQQTQQRECCQRSLERR